MQLNAWNVLSEVELCSADNDEPQGVDTCMLT